jgi:triosephosphate isomerase
MIFVNFKTYPQASGQRAVKLAKICQEVAQSNRIPIIPCVQAIDLSLVVKEVKIPIWVQHVDPVADGKNTGEVTAAAVKLHGASGTLLNHSEHPLDFEDLKKAINLSQEAGLKTLVLTKDLKTAKTIDGLIPEYLGLEEPALIGSKTAMVESARLRQAIKDFVSQTENAIPVIGAGINEESDIKESLALGVKGVLVASGIVLAKNPQSVLQRMAEAFPACS